MNADDFRDYMLSFLFLRYLSDNYEAAAKKELGRGLSEQSATDDQRVAACAIWYDANQDDMADFEKQMRRKVHYVIKPEHLWTSIAELARTQNGELLNTLQEGFKYIEDEVLPEHLPGPVLGDQPGLGKARQDLHTTATPSSAPSSQDRRGPCRIFDRQRHARRCLRIPDRPVRRWFGQEGGRVLHAAADFRASSPASSRSTARSRRPAKRRSWTSVLDFACGSGSLLLNVRKRMGPHGIGKIYGQEKNITTYNLARMNMLLHGVKDTEFEIYHGDTLTNDWDMLRETNPAKKPHFDAVVANPPFSYRWEPTEAMGEDVRFKNYGLAPKSAADFAFLLHGFHYLKDEGVMAIILPHGVLFRGGAEERIRTKLLKDGHIDTVIGLPANLFYSTGIPVCILVLKKCKKPDDVLFINAAEHFEKGKRQNILLPEHIDKIVDTYQFRKEEERYSRRVGMEEIEKNDFNLNISRYVSTAKAEEEVDLSSVHTELVVLEKNIVQATQKHNEFLKELGLPPLPLANQKKDTDAHNG